jgi:arylformamidase
VKIIDISIPLNSPMPIWPNSKGFKLSWTKRLDLGDACNNSVIECDAHVGTHLDAPLHFIEEGLSVENFQLDILIGPCLVVYLPKVTEIHANDLSTINISPDTTRLLIRTDNSNLWDSGITEFRKNFVALTPDAAQWIVDQGIQLLGVDYLSAGSMQDGTLTHKILLGSDVIILEGVNLSQVMPDQYELICLPLKISGAEGSPARAILRKQTPKNLF